jgi:hypothetical protein
VGFRSCHPDEETKNDALKALKDNNIDGGQFVDWKADHCQQAESSKEGGRSIYGNLLRKWNAIFNVLKYSIQFKIDLIRNLLHNN